MFTSEQLDAIDQLLLQNGWRALPTAPPWIGGGAYDARIPEGLAEHGVIGVSLLPPLNAKRRYEKSVWVLVKESDGAQRIRFAPELFLRATLQVGKLKRFHMPAWVGPGEVKVFTRMNSLDKSLGKYGAPSGTREYQKAWREAHPDRVKASNNRYHKKQRELLKVAKALAKKDSEIEQLDEFTMQLRAIQDGSEISSEKP